MRAQGKASTSRSTRGQSKRNSDASEGGAAPRRRSSGRSTSRKSADSEELSFSSIPDVCKGDSFTGASTSPPALEPTPMSATAAAQRKSSGGSSSGRAGGAGRGGCGDASFNDSTSSQASEETGSGDGKRRSSRRTHKEVRRFGEFQSWESVAADEVPPSPAFVGNPKQRRQYLEAYAKVQYEQEAAERKARGETTEDTVADVHSRVQQLMMEANEKLPDYAPSPAKSMHEKSLRERLNESWQGKGYYARLMAQMASPSPARPNMRPPHMQRLHQGANGAAAAANKAKVSEAAKQQAALASMSGAALNGFGGGGGGYLFANLPGMGAPPPAAAAPAPPAKAASLSSRAASKEKRKSGDVMPPPSARRAADKSPEPTKSEDTMESVAESMRKIQNAMRRISMSPARAAFAAASSDSNSPKMAGVQLKFDSPSESSVDVDAALLGDDVEAMKKAIRELRRENEDLRSQLAKTQKEARVAIARVAGGVIAQAKIAEQEFSQKF